MNSPEPSFTMYVQDLSPDQNKISSYSILPILNSSREVDISITLEGVPDSITTAISFELKKTHERIGQILAGNLNHA
jgi:hypothetical protein